MPSELTNDEKLTNAETMRHILTVRTLLGGCVQEVVQRGHDHDRSKLDDPEATMFAKYTKILAGLEYNSPEYKQSLKDMGPALDHHYAHNRHHPEHFEDGIAGMNLFDLLEMLCDWKASTLRHETGDIHRSLEINKDRFEMPEAIYRLLKNTLPVIEQIAVAANASASYPHIE